MSRYDDIWTEISTDPLTRGYSGMTDAEVADSMNTADRTAPRTTITGVELMNNAVPAEVAALSAAERELHAAFIQMDSIPIETGGQGRAMIGALFGAGTATRTNLLALVADDGVQTRGQEIGVGVVLVGEIQRVRTRFGG